MLALLNNQEPHVIQDTLAALKPDFVPGWALALTTVLISVGIAIAIVVIVFAIGESLENLFATIQTWLDTRS